jgi:hypothetical protein
MTLYQRIGIIALIVYLYLIDSALSALHYCQINRHVNNFESKWPDVIRMDVEQRNSFFNLYGVNNNYAQVKRE